MQLDRSVRMRKRLRVAIGAAALGLPWAPIDAQLSLADALRSADANAPAITMANSAASAANAQRLSPLRGILPTVRVDGGYIRTTDPIGAFGTRLKQREIRQADFDPARLNRPNAIGNFAAGLVAEQPLFNADGWLARRATTRVAEASQASATWTRLSTHADVASAYYAGVLAAERVTTLGAAVEAARAHVRQTESLVRAGMATKSDALLASVKSGDIEAQELEARSAASIARRQLALLIGRANDDLTLPAHLPSSAAIRSLAVPDTADQPATAQRADVDAARLGVDAAQADMQRARSLYLPRLNSFARYDWNSPDRLYAGDKSWTVGVLASWSPFEGASQLAETQLATARLQQAKIAAGSAADQARLDVERSLSSLRSALARLDIAERGVAQSVEAHRIVSRKYEGGLATVVELLDAAAVETQSKLTLSSVQFATIVALADHRRALGADPATLIELERADIAGAAR